MGKTLSPALGQESARRALVGAAALAIAAGGVTWAGCGAGGDDQAQTTGERVERPAEKEEKPSNQPKTATDDKKAAPEADGGVRKHAGERTNTGARQKERPTASQGDVGQQKKAGRGDAGSGARGQGDPDKDLADQKAGGNAGGTGQGNPAKDLAEQKNSGGD